MSEPHSLLEPRAPAYTHATVRRAFIVWLRCGQKNTFRDVCDYYHRLEALEDQLPADSRASSRHHEFSLFVKHPPTSPYLKHLFPQLYSADNLETQLHSQAYIQNHFQRTIDPASNIFKVEDMKQGVSAKDIFAASQVFKVPVPTDEKVVKKDNAHSIPTYNTFAKGIKVTNAGNDTTNRTNEDKDFNGTSKREIVETSQMIRNYCKDKQMPLKTFLENFKEYAERCELVNTVNNVGFYIKRKMIHDELKLAVNVKRARADYKAKLETKVKIETKLNFIDIYNFNQEKTSPYSEQGLLAKETQENNIFINVEADTKPQEINITTNDIKKSHNKDDNKTSNEKLNEEFDELNDGYAKLLSGEDNDMKSTTGFSSSHLMKFDMQKCRKI